MKIPIESIRLDGGTQPRAEVKVMVADEYGEAMRAGAMFPPVVVFFDGNDHWLADGFHRVCGAKSASLSEIDADVRTGTKRDAVLHSVGANSGHGLRRTNEDKRRAVQTLLRDPEWSQWSDREIARKCAVSHNLVSEMRPRLSSDDSQRKGGDGRTINTANIGKRIERLDPATRIDPLVRGALSASPLADRVDEVRKLAALDVEQQRAVSEKILRGEASTVKEAVRELKHDAKAAVPVDLPRAAERYRLIAGDLAVVGAEVADDSVDAIITDPPYPREFLPTYEVLARLAARVLKPGGSCVVMVGQSYLPEILAAMTPHLRYQWTCAYLTPGGQATQLWQRKVNTFWKPLLWFTRGEYAGDWIGDVTRSAVNDNDKRFHHWGQSESGMADVVERFTYPGQTILDPFCGGGTTGVVALDLNRLFIGIDVDEDHMRTSAERLARSTTEAA